MGKIREIRIEQKNGQSPYQMLWKLLFALLFSGIIYCELIFTSGLPLFTLAGLLVIAFLCAILQFGFRNIQKKRVYVIAFILLVILYVVLYKNLANGFIAFINASISSWNDKNGTLFYLYVDGSSNLTLDLSIFVILSCLLTLLIVNILVYFGRVECLLFLEYAFFILYVLVNNVHISLISILLTFTIIGYIFLRNTNKEMFKKSKAFWTILVLESTLITYATLFLCSLIPQSNIENIRRASMYKLEQMMYGDKELTDGDLQHVGAKKTDSTVRLHMEHTGNNRMYLKGYVGGRYIGTAWTDIDTEAYTGEHREMLQWMMDMESSDLTLLTLFLYMSDGYKDTGLNIKESKISITNQGAYKKYIYTPYTCMNLSFPFYDNIDRDLNVKNSSIHMTTEYNYEYFDINSRKFENLSNNGCLTDGDIIKNFENYFQIEQEYRNFANTYYLEIPENIQSYFDSNLTDTDITSAKEVTDYIRNYLNDRLTYNTTPSSAYGDDFVLGVLEETKEGYDIHYASIATLMFRYFGIPARYVEGYLADGATGQSLDLTTSDAHAWVEIYRYGMGWIPIEVTPGLYEEETEANTPPVSPPETTQTPISAPNSGVHEPTDSEKPIENPHLTAKDIPILLLLLLLLLMIITIIRRHILLNKQKKRIYSDKLCDSVLYMAGIIWKIARTRNVTVNPRLPNLSREAMDAQYHSIGKIRFDKVLYVLMRAKYSNLEITDEEYSVVKSYLELVTKEAMEHASHLKRFKLKYVYAICK